MGDTLEAPQRRQDEAERPKAPEREPVAETHPWGVWKRPIQVYGFHHHGGLLHRHYHVEGDSHEH